MKKLINYLSLGSLTTAFFAILIFSQIAAGITWDGGGTTNNWSEPANWSGDTLPIVGDNVVFDGTSTKDCVVNVNITVNSMNLNSGYTGTVSMSTGVTADITNSSTFSSGIFTLNDGSVVFGGLFTLGGATINAGSGSLTFLLFTQNSGNFNGVSGNVIVNSTLTINSGSFTAPSGLLISAGNLTIGGAGMFNHKNGEFRVIGFLNVTYTVPSGTIFNNFTIDKSGDSGISINSTIRVIGTLNLTDGLLNTGTVKTENSVAISPIFGAQSGSQGGGFGTLLIQDGPGLRTVTFPVGARFPNVQLNDANATINTSGNGSIITQDFRLDAGSVELGANTLSYGNLQGGGGPAFAQNGGSISVQTGVFTNNVGNFGATVLNGGTFNGGSGTLSFEGGVSLNGGVFNASSGDTFFKRALTVSSSATFNHNGGTITLAFNGLPTVSLTLPVGGANFNNLIFNVGALLSGGNVIVNGTFTQTSGESTVGQIEVKGDMLMQNTALGGSTSILFTGTGAQTYTNNSSNNFSGIWTINKTTGTVDLASDLDITVGAGDFVLTNGTITTGVNKINIGTRNVVRTNGHVIGRLQRTFTTTGTKNFDVGTANGYSPLIVIATTVNGVSSLTVDSTQSIRAGMDPAQSAQRFWTLAETGDLTANLTFNYLQADVNGDESTYKLFKWNGATPTLIASTLDSGANTISAAGISDFSDWAIGNLSPTAAAVEITGRVQMPDGRPIPNAMLMITGGSLSQPVYARTNPFGYFRFNNIQVGNYVIAVSAKGKVFDPPSILVNVDQTIENLNFIASPRENDSKNNAIYGAVTMQ